MINLDSGLLFWASHPVLRSDVFLYCFQVYGAAERRSPYNARHVRLLPERAAVHDGTAAVGASRDRIQREAGARHAADTGTGRRLHRRCHDAGWQRSAGFVREYDWASSLNDVV